MLKESISIIRVWCAGVYFLVAFVFCNSLLAQQGAEFGGFKTRDCQFRFFVEGVRLVAEYERLNATAKVLFNRFDSSSGIVELGFNCPSRVASKEFRTGNADFPQMRIESNGSVFTISLHYEGKGIVTPVVLETKGSSSIARVALPVSAELQPEPVKENAKPLEAGKQSGPETAAVNTLVVKESDTKNAPDSIERAGKDAATDTQSENSHSPSTEQQPTADAIKVKPTTTAAVDDILLPKPDMIDRLSAAQMEKGTRFSGNTNAKSAQVPPGEDSPEAPSNVANKQPGTSALPNGPRTRSAESDSGYSLEPVYEDDLETHLLVLGLVSCILFGGALIFYSWYARRSSGRKRSRQQLKQQGNLDDDLSASYDLLGVRGSDSNDTIKKRYKHLVKVFHADKLKSQDLPEEMLNLATERFQQIQDAYERIKNKRGIT